MGAWLHADVARIQFFLGEHFVVVLVLAAAKTVRRGLGALREQVARRNDLRLLFELVVMAEVVLGNAAASDETDFDLLCLCHGFPLKVE